MTGKRKKLIAEISYFLKKVFLRNEKDEQSFVDKIQSKRKTAFSPEKKAELEKLCEQLFKQKKHITSGKFQFIGLNKIKKRMGKRWKGLCKIVYDTAEEVIDRHLGPADLSIRYKDDTYVIIFALASLEEGRIKAALIAEEIQRQLFESDEEELRSIEVRKAISEIQTDFLTDHSFPDFLDTTIDWEDVPPQKSEGEAQEDMPVAKIEAVEVEAANYRRKTVSQGPNDILPENISFTYLPLWDVPRSALTAYLCLAYIKSSNNQLTSHKNFYQKLSVSQKVSLDIRTLQHVMAELASMEKDGRKLLVACPVHYDTVYHFENYERYKQILEIMPESQKQFLVFVIMNMAESMPPKNAYWFAAPLRAFGRHVFAEVPLRRDVNFNYLRNTGVDVVGVRIDESTGTEQEIISILNGFSAKAKSFKIPRTFVLGISSLSLTTSAVCAGFDFLGGPAIHDAVEKPDIIHRYRHEDLLSTLIEKR
jgi:hypothetical protein